MFSTLHAKMLTLLVALALVGTACGGGDAASTSTTNDTEASPPLTTQPTTDEASEAASAVEETPTVTPEPVEVVALSSVRVGEPEPGGWPLAPGRYTSTAFTSFSLDVEEPIKLVDELPGTVAFAADDATGQPFNAAVLFENLGYADPADVGERSSANAAVDADSTGAWLQGVPGVTITAEGTSLVDGQEAPYWEFTVDRKAVADPFGCSYGVACIHTVLTPTIGFFQAGSGATFRIWDLAHEDGRLGMWTQAFAGHEAATVALAESILAGLRFEEVTVASEPAAGSGSSGEPVKLEEIHEPSPMGLGRNLPAGAYTTALFTPPVSFTTDEDLALFESIDGLVLILPSDFDLSEGSKIFSIGVPLRWVAPDAVLANGALTDDPPEDLGAWGDAATGITVGDSGVIDVGGIESQWWDLTLDGEIEEGGPCPWDCAVVWENEIGGYAMVVGETNRFIRVPHPDGALLFSIEATPESFTEWAQRVAAILDTVEFG